MDGKRKLPKGIQGFEKIRKEGYLYVDKTDMAWMIANGDQNNFLSRPRRFGKSLLTSTLKCYFEGRKELFEGLKIMELEREWPRRAVFAFDFSGCVTADALADYLNGKLCEYERIYGKSDFNQPAARFVSLMEKAHEQTGHSVAVLVDEYDAPLQHTLFHQEDHDPVVAVYQSFFPAMKTGSDHLKCLFLTGITKFTQLSLFSTLNNISILSFQPEYASVCGITQQEILDNFQPELKAMGSKNGWTEDQTIARLKEEYDGYRFSYDVDVSEKVYNPYSLICALDEGRLLNYWASSGGSSLLSQLLEKAGIEGLDLEKCSVGINKMETSDVSPDNVPLFLYQSGYLTIKGKDERTYELGFPNHEVQSALYEIVLPNALRKQESSVSSSVSRMADALISADFETMMENLKQLFSETPYAQKSEEYLSEERYRFILRVAFSLAGCKVEEEKQMATGRIDLVATYRDTVLLFELKLDNNGGLEAAKRQLLSRSYASAFSAEGKRIVPIAVCFCSDRRGIAEYEIF